MKNIAGTLKAGRLSIEHAFGFQGDLSFLIKLTIESSEINLSDLRLNQLRIPLVIEHKLLGVDESPDDILIRGFHFDPFP